MRLHTSHCEAVRHSSRQRNCRRRSVCLLQHPPPSSVTPTHVELETTGRRHVPALAPHLVLATTLHPLCTAPSHFAFSTQTPSESPSRHAYRAETLAQLSPSQTSDTSSRLTPPAIVSITNHTSLALTHRKHNEVRSHLPLLGRLCGRVRPCNRPATCSSCDISLTLGRERTRADRHVRCRR